MPSLPELYQEGEWEDNDVDWTALEEYHLIGDLLPDIDPGYLHDQPLDFIWDAGRADCGAYWKSIADVFPKPIMREDYASDYKLRQRLRRDSKKIRAICESSGYGEELADRLVHAFLTSVFYQCQWRP
ncbi:hypothetical protein [Glycomyces sp. NPDC048151]|uniref:hypothetical protein n=1 Tax=Glycomyces sp. NPDC048151 TaxID=3364002 RepID=UPI0037154AB4